MLPFNPHAIRLATDADTDALRRPAELESQRPLAAVRVRGIAPAAGRA
jgi:hypothetical protein